jgi:hypothetical protein
MVCTGFVGVGAGVGGDGAGVGGVGAGVGGGGGVVEVVVQGTGQDPAQLMCMYAGFAPHSPSAAQAAHASLWSPHSPGGAVGAGVGCGVVATGAVGAAGRSATLNSGQVASTMPSCPASTSKITCGPPSKCQGAETRSCKKL